MSKRIGRSAFFEPVMVPTGPGLGIELDDDQVAAKIDHDWRSKETYDPEDGSVVDW